VKFTSKHKGVRLEGVAYWFVNGEYETASVEETERFLRWYHKGWYALVHNAQCI